MSNFFPAAFNIIAPGALLRGIRHWIAVYDSIGYIPAVASESMLFQPSTNSTSETLLQGFMKLVVQFSFESSPSTALKFSYLRSSFIDGKTPIFRGTPTVGRTKGVGPRYHITTATTLASHPRLQNLDPRVSHPLGNLSLIHNIHGIRTQV